MATKSGGGPASVFDDMLARNRERLDALHPAGRTHSSEASPPAAGPARAAVAASEVAGSEAARRLNERFGDRWRHEIVEQHRDGDEAIVLCKLTLPDQGIVKTQFGRARIAGAVAGHSAGLRFTLGPSSAAQDEAEAYRRAAAAALAKCVELLS